MFNLINKQTGMVEAIGSYDDLLNLRTQLIKEEGGVTSNPEDYYTIQIKN